MMKRLDNLRALDWACLIFVVSVAGCWCLGAGVTWHTMAGGAVSGAVAGPLLRWQGRRSG